MGPVASLLMVCVWRSPLLASPVPVLVRRPAKLDVGIQIGREQADDDAEHLQASRGGREGAVGLGVSTRRRAVWAETGGDGRQRAEHAHVERGEMLVENALGDRDGEDLLEGTGDAQCERRGPGDDVHLGQYHADDEATHPDQPAER